MSIEVSYREVLNNLIRFKDSLLSQPIKKEKTSKREYQVLLNCHTGEMRFATKVLHLKESLVPRRKGSGSFHEWKEVRLIVTDGSDGKTHFDVFDKENHELDFSQEKEMDLIAFRVTKETLSVLNQKVQEVQSPPLSSLPEEEALRDLSSIRLRSQEVAREKIPGWAGPLTRSQAEKRLQGQKVGTYLIRTGDTIIDEAIQSLERENHCSIRYYILTFVREEQRIGEELILQVDGKWILYRDEPKIHSEQYNPCYTLEALLCRLSSDVRYPL